MRDPEFGCDFFRREAGDFHGFREFAEAGDNGDRPERDFQIGREEAFQARGERLVAWRCLDADFEATGRPAEELVPLRIRDDFDGDVVLLQPHVRERAFTLV